MYKIFRYIIVALLLFGSNYLFGQEVTLLNSEKVYKLIKKDTNIVIIDARDSTMFKNGHIKRAINIDAFQKDIKEKINHLNKEDRYLLYCQKNFRSGYLKDLMLQLEFTNIIQMTDGYSGWISKGLPVISKK